MRQKKLTLAVVLSVLGLGLWLSGASAYAQFTITRTSSPVFYIDSGVSPQLKGMYVSYKVCNTSGTTYPDIWVTASNFTGGIVSLAPHEDGVVHIGPINAGQCKAAFFYLQASGPTTTPQSHTIRVFAGPPSGTPLASQTFTFTSVEETIQASANKVNSVVISTDDPILGTLIIITVTGESGTIGADRVMSYTPAAYTTWRADCYMLYKTTITLSGGNSGTFTDQLLIPPSSLPSSANTNYTAMYTFRVADVCTLPTRVSPVAYISSGQQVKHTATGEFGELPPLNPGRNNLIILSKTATPHTLPGTGGVVTYTITFANGAAADVTLDDVRDTLPTTPAIPTYVSGSSQWAGSPIPDPVISSNILTWYGFLTVPAGSTATLRYQVAFPAINCVSYHNSAVGHIGPVQIDTTLDTTDNAPAQETVNVGTNCQDLTITKTHTGNFVVGQQGTYTITVTNVGGASTTGTITMTDTLPTGLSYVSATGPGWSCSAMGQTVTCTNPGPLAPSNSSSITITVNVLLAAYPSVDNTATVSTPGDTNDHNNQTGDTTLVDAPDLAISKTHAGSFTVGQNGAYTITVTNVGTASTSGTITVIDTLPPGLSFVSGTGPGWSCSAVGQTVTCTNPGPLAPNTSSDITLVVSVGPEAVPSVTNSVTVTNPYDPDPSDNSDDDPTDVEPVADLRLTKTVDNPNPNLGDTITFTVTVTNDGPNTATGVIVTDQLPAGLTFVSYTASQGSYNPVTGIWTVGTLTVGASATLTIQAIVSTVSAITNTAEVTASDQLDPDSTPNNNNPAEDDQATVIVAGQIADLSLQKTVDNPTPGVGSNVTFTITVRNSGPNTATNVVVQDQLPAGLSLVSYTVSQGSYNPGTGIWVVGNLLNGATATLTITATVTAPGNITNIAQVIGVDQPDPDSVPNNNDPTEDDQDDVTLDAQPADLTITKTHSGSFAVGYTGTYTLTVTNIGAGSTTGPIVVTDTLPTGLTFVSGTGPAWTCSAALQIVTCTNPGPLGPGASTTITITVNVSLAAFPSVTNSATVSTPDDGNPDNNSDDDPTDVVAPDLQIIKSHTGDFTTGSNGIYTITVTNVGNGPTHGPIVVTDTLPTGLTFVSGTGPGWTCSAALQVVTCTNLGPLAAGASTMITLTVSVSIEAAPSVVNSASVLTPDDTNPDNNSDDDPTNVNTRAGQICGFKWLDLDADGNRAENEPYLPGITITLVGVDIFGNPVTLSTVTDENGQYCFTGLVPGTYLICEAPPEEIPFFETFPVSGPACPNGTIGWLIDLGDGQTVNRIKFGNVPDEPTLISLSVAAIQAVATPQAVYFRALGQGIKEIAVELFDLSGRAIYRSGWQKNNLFWAYQTERAERVAPGVYLYSMSVKGYDGTVIKTELRKLVVSPKPSVVDQLLAKASPKVTVLAQRDGIQFKLLGQGTREFSVQVFDLSGRPVYMSDWMSTSVLWKLQNDKGQRIAKGVYLYVVTVRGPNGQITRTKLQKLIVK